MTLKIDVDDVFAVFTQYGLKRTSMEDVAKAVGYSRQTIYTEFNSKENLIQWMVTELLDKTLCELRTALALKTGPLDERLVFAFDCWTGKYIDTFRASPHSAEIIDMGVIETEKDRKNNVTSILSEFSKVIAQDNSVDNEKRAQDIAYTLYCASQGLTLTAKNREAYVKNMRRIIKTVIN